MNGRENPDSPAMGRRQFLKAAIAGIAGLGAVVAGLGSAGKTSTSRSPDCSPRGPSGASNVSDHTARYFVSGDRLAG